MNTHEKINELLVPFALGELSEQAEGEVKTHLAQCPQCSSELKRLQALLECTGRISELSADEQTCESAKQAVLTAVKNREKESTAGLDTGPAFIWRKIMNSKLTKLAAAAVIIIVVSLVLQNGSVDIASTAFADITEAMKKVPWMHVVIEETYSGKQDRLETWTSFESQIHVSKKADGKIIYQRKRALHEYDPDSGTITISYGSDNGLEDMGSVWGYWENMMEMVSDAEGQIIEESSQYEGKEAKIYQIMIASSPFGMPMELKIIADAEKNLPVFLNQKAFGPNGEVTIEANAYFDYPESGPADIYEVGVPRTAKVVNKLQDKDVTEIMEAYQSHRESAPSRYIAIVTNSWFEKKFDDFRIFNVSIIYRNGKAQRIDEYELPQIRRKELLENQAKLEEELGNTFESQSAWWKENGQITAVNLYDGKFQYEVSRKDNKWVKQPKRYMAHLGDSRGDNDLADFGWGVLFLSPRQGSSPFILIEDDYARKYNLMCLESKCQGTTTDTGWAILPKRVLCYLNPQRDFICQRFEEQDVLDAPWQKDKSWLEAVDPDKISTEQTEIREVTEFAQTDMGQWYPKVIEQEYKRGPDDRSVRRQTVFLKTDIEFPMGIFDPENLPRGNE